MIYVIARDGLGNRMRVIHSAYYLSEKIKKKIKVIWLKDKNLNCRYNQLFKPLKTPYFKIIEGFNIWHYALGLINKPNYLNKLIQKIYFDKVIADPETKSLINKGFDYSKIAKYRNVLIKTCYQFYVADKKFNLFEPIEDLQQRIISIVARFNNTIGIHVRRTDNKHSITNSPDHLFYNAIDNELSKNPAYNFYLATDSALLKKEIKEKYGSKIITIQTNLSRNTSSGIQDALVDLYCLANTNKIYGSYYSTFTIIASRIFNVPLVVLQTGNLEVNLV